MDQIALPNKQTIHGIALVSADLAWNNMARSSQGRIRMCLSHRNANMKELHGKVIFPQHRAELRVLYAFDPRRTAILLIDGDKTGNPRWYEEYVPIADQLFDDHLKQIERDGIKRKEKRHGKEFP